jgi:cob(I)alamin adenosyltransferase
MVKLDKIYTRGGDKGETSLGSGARVAKHDLRVTAYGTSDETNAIIGIARLHTEGEADAMLARIQNDLFDLGADLCTPEGGERRPKKTGGALRVTAEQVSRLEAEIDAMNENLNPLTSFILPGGTPAGAYLHLARTVARRCERLLTELAGREELNPECVKYVNRLSDHLFQLSRHVNDNGKLDVLWQPGATQ